MPMTVSPRPEPLDDERRAAQARLEVAVGEGRLTLDDFTQRSGRIWAATDSAEVARTLDDLPPPPVVGGSAPARSTLVSVIGDIRRRGRWALRSRTRAWLVIGDVELDLRSALIGNDEITIEVYSLIGDVEVIAPEGVEVELGGFSLLGDRRVDLAPVPRVPGTPIVRVRVVSLIGDAKVRSAR